MYKKYSMFYKDESKVLEYFDKCEFAVCISQDWSSSKHVMYLLWLVELW